MNSAPPLVSIIIATYNREQFILEALQSVADQSYSNWECLIIDDGGVDNTSNIISPILNNDSRFKYLKRPEKHKKGLPGSRNYGLSLAKGEYIVFFDDDDVVHPLNLEICVSVFKEKANMFFCNYLKKSFIGSFDYGIIDKDCQFNTNQTNSDLLKNVITHKTPFASCTVMWRKECFIDNNFNENLMYAEEWECYQRILSANIKGVIIDKILYYNRKHEQSNTGEFWKKDTARVTSKKEAIKLIVSNLNKKELLTPYLFKYLVNLAISFRDFKLLKSILKISKPKLKLFYTLKYYLYPVWVFYKNRIKRKN